MSPQHHFVRRAFAWVMVTLVALLSACVAPAINANQELTDSEGAVVLKFIPKGSTPSDPVELLTTLFVEEVLPPNQDPPSAVNARAASPRPYQLNLTKLSTNSTMVFSGLLPPGKYTITHMTGQLYPTIYTFPMRQQLPPFEVKAKTATMLGTIMVQPGTGRSFAIGYVAPEDEFRETFKQLYPALEAQARDIAPLGFDKSEKLTREAAMATSFRSRIASLNGLTQGADGTLYAGTRTGMALMRRPNDPNWRMLDLRSWREVMSLRPFRDGLVAAGEEGLLKLSKDEGRTWTTLQAPDQGLIYAVEPTPAGHLVAATRYRGVWNIYRSDDPTAGNWVKLATFPHESSLNAKLSDARVVAHDAQLGVMLPNGTYHVIDTDKGTVEKFAGSLSVLDLWASPGGRLVQRGVTVTSKTIVSDNFGRSWSDVNLGRFTVCVVFKDKNIAYAVSPVDPGVTAGNYALMASRDGGKTWAPSGVVPGGVPGVVSELLIDRSDGTLLAVLKNATVLRSKDEGATWVGQVR